MPTIRKYVPEFDKPKCVECGDRSEIVIDDYPAEHQHKTLCRDCATAVLQNHPNLLASLVITLILGNSRPVLAASAR